MNKIAVKMATAATLVALGLTLVGPVLALDLPERVGSRPGLLKKVFETNRGRAALGTGVIKSKSGNAVPATLVVTKDGKDYTVNVDDKTQLRRRFWGKATLAEMSVGDTVNVIGLWTDDTKTTIQAKLIRDASIEKRFGVFIGTVLSLSSSGWTMQTGRGVETVTVSSATKFVNRKGETLFQADVKVGHKVRAKGLWDNKLNTVTEVSGVKDYSLPTK